MPALAVRSSLTLLIWLLAISIPVLLPLLQGWNGNQPWHHPVLWPVVLAWLCCQGCACGSSKGTSRYPVLLPLMRAHRYHAAVETSRILCVGTSDLMDQVEKHFPAGRGISFVIWQRLQYRDVFILKAFADLVSLNSSEAAVNY